MRIVRSCRGCAGVGNIEETRRYRVTLPPGTRDGDLRLIAGQGEPGQLGGRPGDLEVRVKVAPHPVLRQQGHDLLVNLPLGLAAAALGGTVEVPTIDGRVRMKIPAGTQSGRLFRLRGMGVPRASGRGDQIVQVEVETPVELDESLRERLLAFVEGCSGDNEPLQRAFWERVEAAEAEE
jgi:molecular chaperone DnaJ